MSESLRKLMQESEALATRMRLSTTSLEGRTDGVPPVQIAVFEALIAGLEKSQGNLSSAEAKLQADRQAFNQEKSKLQEEQASVEETRTELQQRQDSLQEAEAKLRQEQAAHQHAQDQLQRTSDVQLKRYDELLAWNRELGNREAELDDQTADARDEAESSLSRFIAQLSADVRNIGLSQDGFLSTENRLQQEIDRLSGELQDSKRTVTELNAELLGYEGHADMLTAAYDKIGELQSSLKDVTKERDDQKRRCDDLAARLRGESWQVGAPDLQIRGRAIARTEQPGSQGDSQATGESSQAEYDRESSASLPPSKRQRIHSVKPDQWESFCDRRQGFARRYRPVIPDDEMDNLSPHDDSPGSSQQSCLQAQRHIYKALSMPPGQGNGSASRF